MRAKKALYNIITEALRETITFICALILPRLILTTYGSSYNGVVSSITQFLGYISVLTLGISGAIRVAVYKAKDDIEAKSAIVKASEKYMHKVACALVVYTAILAIIYPYLVRDEFEWLETASLVVIISIGVFAEYLFGIAIRAFLSAEQSNYIWNIMQIISKIASTVIAVILIYAGQSIQIVKLSSAVILAIAPILANIVAKKKFHLKSEVKPDVNALSARKDVVAHSIANIVYSNTDIFLLTVFTDPITVSIYSIYTLVFSSARKIQEVFTTGMEGAFGSLWARGEYKQYKENFVVYEFLCFSFVSVIFPCIGILLLPFIQLYTKGVHDANYILPFFAYLSVITHAFYGLRTPYVTAVQSAGHYKETKKYAFIEAGLNFSISFCAVFWNGLIGVTFGTLFANLYRTVQYAAYASKHLINRHFGEFIKRCLWLGLNFVVIVLVAHLIIRWQAVVWETWIFNGVICFVVSLCVTAASAYVFYKNDFLRLVGILKRMIKRN